jgi:hypothetical protein
LEFAKISLVLRIDFLRTSGCAAITSAGTGLFDPQSDPRRDEIDDEASEADFDLVCGGSRMSAYLLQRTARRGRPGPGSAGQRIGDEKLQRVRRKYIDFYGK